MAFTILLPVLLVVATAPARATRIHVDGKKTLSATEAPYQLCATASDFQPTLKFRTQCVGIAQAKCKGLSDNMMFTWKGNTCTVEIHKSSSADPSLSVDAACKAKGGSPKGGSDCQVTINVNMKGLTVSDCLKTSSKPPFTVSQLSSLIGGTYGCCKGGSAKTPRTCCKSSQCNPSFKATVQKSVAPQNLSPSRNSGPIASKITPSFRNLAGVAPAKLKTKDLQDAMLTAVKAFRVCGFNDAADHLNKNAVQLSGCPQGTTIDGCLQSQETSGGHPKLQNKSKGKYATLKDPSPAVGIIWSMRILGFMAELFRGSANGQSLHDAGDAAYETHIRSAFDRHCTFCTDFAVNKLVKTALVSALSNEKYYLDLVGGAEVAKRDMKEFAEAVLPIVAGVWGSIDAHNLDDSRGKN